MGFFDVIKAVGKTAASFIPGGNVAISALEGIGKMAQAVGGDTGKKIEQGLSTVTDGLRELGQTPLPPEIQVRMAEIKTSHEREMAEINFKEKSLPYEDQAGGREVIKTGLLSDDPVVRRARPTMMLYLGKMSILYAFYAPVSVIAASYALQDVTMDLFMGMVKWIGGFLFTAFMTSFTGYTVGRSADKKTAAYEASGLIAPGSLKKLAGIANKVGSLGF